MGGFCHRPTPLLAPSPWFAGRQPGVSTKLQVSPGWVLQGCPGTCPRLGRRPPPPQRGSSLGRLGSISNWGGGVVYQQFRRFREPTRSKELFLPSCQARLASG